MDGDPVGTGLRVNTVFMITLYLTSPQRMSG